MTYLKIRKMFRADVPAIMELYKQPDMDNGKGLAVREVNRLLDRIATYPFYRFYVAIIYEENETGIGANTNEKIVGVFGLLIMENLGHCGAPSAIVEGVCVDPQFQGMGIGKEMMQEAMKISRDRGCYKLALTSNVKRESAHRFYRSLGFEQHGLSFQIDL